MSRSGDRNASRRQLLDSQASRFTLALPGTTPGKRLLIDAHVVQPVLTAAALALGLALLLAPMLAWLCRALGWVDHPGGHKEHEAATPLAGGLVIAISVLLACLAIAARPVGANQVWLGAVMVLAVGLADDRFPLRARYRFAVQLCAAFAFVVSSGALPTDLGRLLGPFVLWLGVFGLPFAMIGIAGLTNAVNMIDGLDGLAGGVVLGALLWLLVAFALIAGDAAASAPLVRDAREAALLSALVAGALAGFLFFNQRAPWRTRASMFLGDGGSMMLGFVVGALCLYASSAFGEHGMTPVTAPWIVAVPLVDMFASILRRMLRGRTPMTPDRHHVHHLLLALGLSNAGTVLTLQAANFLAGLIGVAGWRLGVPEHWMFWALVVLLLGYHFAASRAWRRLERTQGA